jgi:hypothetical protein
LLLLSVIPSAARVAPVTAATVFLAETLMVGEDGFWFFGFGLIK